METKDKTDYAAAYRQYCTYGRGRSIKRFCEDENYNYTKFRRYVVCFMYSLVESCGFNSLSPMKYISHLLAYLPDAGKAGQKCIIQKSYE